LPDVGAPYLYLPFGVEKFVEIIKPLYYRNRTNSNKNKICQTSRRTPPLLFSKFYGTFLQLEALLHFLQLFRTTKANTNKQTHTLFFSFTRCNFRNGDHLHRTLLVNLAASNFARESSASCLFSSPRFLFFCFFVLLFLALF
jgi:hypothetical protein